MKKNVTVGNWCFQGDVTFSRIDKLPDNLKPHKTPVLVEGEATGHCHSVLESDLDIPGNNIFIDEGGKLFIENETEVKIVHQEHGTTTLPPGSWLIDQQQEYDPFEEQIHKVRD